METVCLGDRVFVRYTGRLKGGAIFDSTDGREPFEFQAGSAGVIEGVSKAVIGMAVGEKKEIAVAPEHGFGRRDPRLVAEVPKSLVASDATVTVGTFLRISDAQKRTYVARVQEIREDCLVIDANHPLADEVLFFDLELVGLERGEEAP